MIKPIEIVVGGSGPYDPAAGTSVCNIPIIAGQEVFLEKTGYGTYDYNLYSSLSTGGFQLIGNTFTGGERFYVHLTGLGYGTTSGSYTNGFDFNRVINALFGRLGWKQPDKTGSPVINATNLISKSYRRFNDGSFHALVSIDNIKATMEEAGASDVNLNAHLESLQRAAIMRSLNRVFSDIDKPEYIEQGLLFNRLGQNDQSITNTGQFAGYEINVAPDMGIGVQIDSATLLFDQDVTFNLYLFKDGKKSPLSVIQVSAIANEATVVNFSDLVLNYIGSATKGSRFYFGYFQDDLGAARAIQEQICSMNKTRCFSAMPAVSKKNAGEYDFDRNQRSYTVQPYGINLEMSSFRDHTQQIVKKANLFDEVIGLTVAYMTIEQIIYAVRSNVNERILKDELARVGVSLDLTGSAPLSDSPKIKGLTQRIDEEYKRMRKSFFPKAKPITVNFVEC
jgi:hypothetical protein